ncbi:C4b-binding protein beta chain [Rhynchocyon petersi]
MATGWMGCMPDKCGVQEVYMESQGSLGSLCLAGDIFIANGYSPISSLENCPDPPSVDNSIFVAKEVEGQIWLTYMCIKGYHLVGKKTLFCNASVEWDAPVPTCQLGHCPMPVLFNGEFNSSGPVNVDDKITFQCKNQYILKGSSWSQCLEDHTWEPPLPICKSRHCGPPGNPAHGYFEGNNFSSGSNITYFCEKRYRLVGTQHQQCINGEWSSALPYCQRAPQTKLEEALVSIMTVLFLDAFLALVVNFT